MNNCILISADLKCRGFRIWRINSHFSLYCGKRKDSSRINWCLSPFVPWGELSDIIFEPHIITRRQVKFLLSCRDDYLEYENDIVEY